ncbi:hypothetical protein [Streptomyces sp. HO565]|uniref:oxidoreductase n=1 Tax=Streptomyces sp. HO565 TaxID=2857489 RepID=UPI0034DBACA4
MRLVIDAVLEQAGPHQAVGLRISAHEGHADGLSADETFDLLKGASLERLHFLDVSAGSYEAGEWIVQPGEWKPGVLAPYAERYRRAYGLAAGVPGRINTPEAAAHILRWSQADFISMARTLHADPEFPNRALERPTGRVSRATCASTNFIRAAPSGAVSTRQRAVSTSETQTGTAIAGRGYWWSEPARPAWRRHGCWRNVATGWS